MSFLRKLFGIGSASLESPGVYRGRLSGEATPETPDEFEASMNFDLENVRPFLERLHDRRGIGIDVDALARFTHETTVEDERHLEALVPFEAREVPLRYTVFMDDVDAPDLYFFTRDKVMIDAINAEWDDFTEELGI